MNATPWTDFDGSYENLDCTKKGHFRSISRTFLTARVSVNIGCPIKIVSTKLNNEVHIGMQIDGKHRW